MTNNFRGIIFMLLHALAAAILFVLVKILTIDLNSSLVVFLYKFTLLILVVPMGLKDGLSGFYTARIRTYIIGGILGTAATLCLMYGIKYIPVANATALGYLEKVLLIIIGAIYFKEKIQMKQIIAIIICFIGAMVVIFPKLDFQEYNLYYCYIFASIVLWVAYCLAVKSLGKTENAKTQVFYTILLSTILSAPVALINWQECSLITFPELELKHWILIFLISICYLVLSVTAFKSFQCGDLSVISPFGYSKVVFAGVLGVIILQEYPSLGASIGYIIIAGSSWYLLKFQTLR